MVLWLIFGTMAAFGTVCAMWAVLGWLLPDGKCIVRCRAATGEDALRAAERFRWLRWFGLVRWEFVLDCEEFDQGLLDRLRKMGITVSAAQTEENGAGSI